MHRWACLSSANRLFIGNVHVAYHQKILNQNNCDDDDVIFYIYFNQISQQRYKQMPQYEQHEILAVALYNNAK